jgi:hypothetical protein
LVARHVCDSPWAALSNSSASDSGISEQSAREVQRQSALADPAFAGAHGHEMAHAGEPVGDAAALLGNLLEDSGPSVADDVVVALHGRLSLSTGEAR